MINRQQILNYRQRVEENLDLFMSVAADKGYPVPRPPVFYKAKMTRAAGTCSAIGITLSVDYLAEHEDTQVWHTLGHEFAHWIQRHHNMFTFTRHKRIAHNDKFYALCRMLGVSDSRCHSMDLQNVRARRTTKIHSTHCACSTHKVTKAMYTKILTGSTYRCNTCKSKLVLGPLQKGVTG